MTKRRACSCAAVALAAVFAFAGTVRADGRPVMPWFHRGQYRPGLAADGAGGAWLAFKTGDLRFGLAHIAPDGRVDPAWPAGVYTAGVTAQLSEPSRVLASGAGAMVLVSDYCAYNGLATAYGTGGAVLPGFPASATKFYPAPGAVLGAGGRVLAAVSAGWGAGTSGVRYAIVSPADLTVTEIEYSPGMQVLNSVPVEVASDDAGGMFVGFTMFFTEDYSSGFDLGLVRVAGDGTRPWAGGWKAVCTSNGNQNSLCMTPDGAGGVLLAWTDARTGGSPTDIYAARFNSAGTLVSGWLSQGERITNSAGAQFEPSIVGDGAGGAWIVWRDERTTDINLYYTHFAASGAFAPGFSLAGTLLCGAGGAQSDVQVAPDGAGGFFAVWLDPRDGEADLYGTHVTSAGTLAAGWPADGLALCDDPAQQLHPALARTGFEQALVAWRDTRADSGQVYVLALAGNGPVQVTGVGHGTGAPLRLRAAANPAFGLPDLRLACGAGESVELELLDVAGRVVRRASERGTGAEVRVRIGGGPLPAGVYFARARAGERRETLRVCVLR